jgi:hypothetical protein
METHNFYHYNKCDAGSHKKKKKKKQNKKTPSWHFNILYLLFVLYKSMMMNWVNPKQMTKVYEWEYKLCSDWCIILLSSTTPLIVVRVQQGWTALQLWWNEWLISQTGHFTAREGAHSTQWIDGWMGLTASLDILEKSWISCPCRDLNPR